jgi:hypothetical protein
LEKHFFLIRVQDNSVSYAPNSKIIIDIPTALNFFADPDGTETLVADQTKDLARRWNQKYLNKKEVRIC